LFIGLVYLQTLITVTLVEDGSIELTLEAGKVSQQELFREPLTHPRPVRAASTTSSVGSVQVYESRLLSFSAFLSYKIGVVFLIYVSSMCIIINL